MIELLDAADSGAPDQGNGPRRNNNRRRGSRARSPNNCAKLTALPASNQNPSMPGRTFSRMPPIFEQITGLPLANAS